MLFLAANPVQIPPLQVGEECRAIADKIREARFRDQLCFRSRWAARPGDLLRALHEDDPTVLHFSGHGAGAEGLCLSADDGSVIRVSLDGLAQVIRAAGDSIKLIVLNACYTKVQAEALVAHVPCVIGMPDAIGDKAAIDYAADLYLALAFGKSVASAHQCGLAALALRPPDGPARDLALRETAEMALRTSTPEVLTQTGHDASSIYIVSGVEDSRISGMPSEGTRVHLEITIDTEFESVDAESLGRIVMDVCRLSGGQPVKIICVRKGSLRITISFTPEAARTLLELRNRAELTEICGLTVTRIVELGHVETASKLPLTLEPPAREDLEAVFAEVRPALLRMAEHMCGIRADAEDVLQETFLRAIRHGIPPDIRNVAAWLTTTLKHVILDHYRSAQRRPSHQPITDDHHGLTQLALDGPEPEWSRITLDHVREALEEIEPVYREVYRLHTFEDLSYAQIAQRLGIQRATVGTRLNRARKKLREILVARFGLRDEP